MATSYIIQLALPLLILSSAHGYKDNLQGQDNEMIQGLGEAMHCFAEMMQESLRLQRQLAINTLPHVLEHQADGIQSEDPNFEKNHVVASRRAARIIEDIGSLDKQLEYNNKKVQELEQRLAQSLLQVDIIHENERRLTAEVHELEQKLEESRQQVVNISDSENRLNNEVQELEKKLAESRQQVVNISDSENRLINKVQYLVETLAQSRQQTETCNYNEKHLNNTVVDLTNRLSESLRQVKQYERIVQQLNNAEKLRGNSTHANRECEQYHQTEIKNLVQEYLSSKDWVALKRGLEQQLDSGDVAHSQLQSIRDDILSPLWLIGRDGLAELAAVLLCAGLPVDTTDDDGDTMLHGAAWGSSLPLVDMLLRHGADVNARGTGWTPLMRAAFSGQLGVARMLVQAGARTTDTDDDGRIALDFARVRNQTAVINYLQHLPH